MIIYFLIFQKDSSRDLDKGLSPYQCELLDLCLNTIRIYFHAGGRGLKRSFLKHSLELHSLRQILALYSQATDELLKNFVTTQTSQGKTNKQTKNTHLIIMMIQTFEYNNI